MEVHPHPRQAEVLLVEWLQLLWRLQGLARQKVLELKEDELKRPGQALM